jgi:hypothetical protein
MLSLLKSERFQKEYADFQTKISAITNESVKREATGLLNLLVNEIRTLDNGHIEVIGSAALSSGVSDTRNRISEVRGKLIRKLEEWSRASV